MSKYSPKIDLVFRKLFGSEENKDILISLVNGILDCKPEITDLTIRNPYNLATYVGGKTSILDIKAVDNKGVWYDIELQIGEHGFYGKRALYYLSKMYVDQLEEAEEYAQLNKTIGIHLLDFEYFPDDRYRRHFVYKDMETNEHPEHLSYQQLYFIELSKFHKDWHELKSLLDRWIAFLNKAHKLDRDSIPEELKKEAGITKAIEKLEVMCFDKLEQEIYEAEKKKRMDDKEELRTAEFKGKAEGREEGKAEGKAEGREEGKVEGKAEGRAEMRQEVLEKMVNAGISIDEARKILGI